MVQDEDFLIRHIRQLVAIIVQLIVGKGDEARLEEALQSAYGLTLYTLDLLTPDTLLSMYNLDDPRDHARLQGLVEVLEALAQQGLNAQSRADKAASLRAALDQHARLRASP